MFFVFILNCSSFHISFMMLFTKASVRNKVVLTNVGRNKEIMASLQLHNFLSHYLSSFNQKLVFFFCYFNFILIHFAFTITFVCSNWFHLALLFFQCHNYVVMMCNEKKNEIENNKKKKMWKRKQHILNNEKLLIVPSSKYFNLQATMEASDIILLLLWEAGNEELIWFRLFKLL